MRNKNGPTCEEVLLKYLQENEGWHKKVYLYTIAEDWSPETVGRDLRTLHEKKKKIFVDYYKGKYTDRLAMYSAKPKEPVVAPRYEIVEIDGRPVARFYE